MCSRCGCALGAFMALAVGSLTVSAHPEEALRDVRLEVLVTAAPSLPQSARTSMMNEAAGIWRGHGVVIDWLPATAVLPHSPHRLRALVVERRQPLLSHGEPLTVGELVRPSNGHAMAIMSIDSARRLMASVRGRAGYDLATVDHRRLGLVLGRALAHEIGHYLLETPTHASYGLMRPQFDALEFTDFRTAAFALDRTASNWLKSHLNLGAMSNQRVEPSRFAYAR